MSYDSGRQAGTIETVRGHGVWVPEDLDAETIWRCAEVLVADYEMERFHAQGVVRTVLAEARKPNQSSE